MRSLSPKEQKLFQNLWAKIVAKAWNSENYKKRLLENPTAILKEEMKKENLELPQDVIIKIVENTNHENYLVLPKKPSEALTEESLKSLSAAGDSWCSL